MDFILGKKIVAIRPLIEAEKENEGWLPSDEVYGIVLENGAVIYPSRDAEGNAPGELFIQHNSKNYMISPND